MTMAKTDYKKWLILIIILLLLLLGSCVYKDDLVKLLPASILSGGGSPYGPNYDGPDNPFNPQPQNPSWIVNILMSPKSICFGESSNLDIITNMQEGACWIFAQRNTVNPPTWGFYKKVDLVNGRYSEQITDLSPGWWWNGAIGTHAFFAVCQYGEYTKVSNYGNLTVRDCSHPRDENTANETDACTALCTSKGYASGRGPVDSPGRCNAPEIYTQNYDYTLGCCCTPTYNPADECSIVAANQGFPHGKEMPGSECYGYSWNWCSANNKYPCYGYKSNAGPDSNCCLWRCAGEGGCECRDFDAGVEGPYGDIMTSSYVFGEDCNNHADYCVNSNTVGEYSCVNGKFVLTPITCPGNFTCSGNRCI